MLAKLQRTYNHYFWKPYLQWYLKKKRTYTYNGLNIVIYPGVFHPKYFFSTQVLLKFLQGIPLKKTNFCEPGAGSGILSLTAYKMGASVTAFDVNENAINGLVENFRNNFSPSFERNFNTYISNLFENVPKQTFDNIFINPPYFFADATTKEQQAWYCGKNGEYFEKLFSQLRSYSNDKSNIYMILGDNCEIGRIQQIANKYQFVFNLVVQEKTKWEINCIFKLTVK